MLRTNLTPNNNTVNCSSRQSKNTESRLIIKALKQSNSALTRRQLSNLTGLEIATLCRALYNLVYKRNSVIIAYYKPCKVTGKRVMHFAIKKGKEGGKCK